jgi:hypothetical protein
VKFASASVRCTFLELIDFFERERKSCPSNDTNWTQLEKKNVEFLPKSDPIRLFAFSCNTRNVVSATLSTVITAVRGE